MRLIFTILMVFLLECPAAAQQDLKPATVNDITYRNGRAYVDNELFTGILFDIKTKKALGQFRNGLKNGNFTEYFDNGNTKFEGLFINGLRDGLHIDYYENGTKRILANFRQDVLDGEFIEFYHNGKINKKSIYKLGKKVGLCSEYYENGQFKLAIDYLDDKIKDGTYSEYDDKGIQIIEIKARSGVIQSKYNTVEKILTVYHDYSSNIKKEEGKIINNRKNGLWIERFSNGQISFEGEYKDDIREGFGKEYNSYGELLWEGEFSNDKINGNGVLLDGRILYKGQWTSGVKNGKFIVTFSDKSWEEGEFDNNLKEGLWKAYYSNGSKKSEIVFNKGENINGDFKEWYDNGQNKEEKFLANSLIEGSHTKWHKNGQVLSSMKYKNGKVVDGQYFVYDERGGIVSESNYNNGLEISSYLYSLNQKNGAFHENYANGKPKVAGVYKNGRRVVQERYGANKTTNRVLKGIGGVALLVGIGFLGIMTGTL
ncbi:toxin-antitoxin system YwqK family antitoxin [Bacteroidales bacterium MB20-C3-3]|jgi:antitoxin component YwqK of YwqJK toxin-antitoxin module|nr:toxin-antitoxin system YwqK family antitoxin [Bacteroidales bacterium MB20-C3-3]